MPSPGRFFCQVVTIRHLRLFWAIAGLGKVAAAAAAVVAAADTMNVLRCMGISSDNHFYREPRLLYDTPFFAGTDARCRCVAERSTIPCEHYRRRNASLQSIIFNLDSPLNLIG
ncbi:exported protein of unknown function [Candidatus Filomicrobium marinum]|uniref:Uncharacterized protein n=1 Tax=Candidatus Filomicrobium marinum TaxID=1608628 RepID=A0A0D6JFY6_9HYPH|nr:exported protein of unknown function [Candidatus Filomicrobium marinum]